MPWLSDKWHFDGTHSRNHDFWGLPKLKRPAVLIVDEIKIKALLDLSKEIGPLNLLFSGGYRQIQQVIGIGYHPPEGRCSQGNCRINVLGNSYVGIRRDD